MGNVCLSSILLILSHGLIFVKLKLKIIMELCSRKNSSSFQIDLNNYLGDILFYK